MPSEGTAILVFIKACVSKYRMLWYSSFGYCPVMIIAYDFINCKQQLQLKQSAQYASAQGSSYIPANLFSKAAS